LGCGDARKKKSLGAAKSMQCASGAGQGLGNIDGRVNEEEEEEKRRNF
jgi:hypothetical protein